MAAGLGLLRLPPQHFWAMTPRELAHALEGVLGRAAPGPISRTDIDRLLARFPDGERPPQRP